MALLPICRATLLALIFLLLPLTLVCAQSPTWAWATGTTTYSPGRDVALDAAGNVYALGSFSGTLQLGSNTLVSAGSTDVFVAKYSPTGTVLWAVRAGGPMLDDYSAICLDPVTGDVVLVTNCYGTGTYGPFTVGDSTATPVFHGVMARITAGGSWREVVTLPSTGSAWLGDVATDATGAVYVIGSFSGTLTFGSTTLQSGTTGKMLVAKFSPTGAPVWIQTAGGPRGTHAYRLAVSPAGEVTMTIECSDSTLSLGAITLLNPGIRRLQSFVAHLTAAGAWQWATINRCFALNSIAVDSATGDAVVAGVFDDTATFGGITRTTLAPRSGCVARVSAAGVWQWVTITGNPAGDFLYATAFDRAGRVVVAGTYQGGPFNLGATTLPATAPPAGGGLVGYLSADGAWLQAATTTGGSAIFSGLAVDGAGRVTVAGLTSSDTVSLGAYQLPGVRPSSLVVAQLTPGLLATPALVAVKTASVWPNPTHEAVRLTGFPPGTLTLVDALGRAVLTTIADAAGAATLPVAGLPPGVYVVRAGATARRLVVE